MRPSAAEVPTARRGRAGLVLGIGLGGFADGIALHQIAQWHNMGSAVLPPHTMDAMRQNMVWDGLFHAATWWVTLAGVWLLWQDAHRGAVPPGRVFIGQMLLGWAGFNLAEGIIDHHLLNLHHVRDLPAHVPAYDWAFLLVGGILLGAIGWMMSRPASASPAR
ncbi:MAG TPA: DUF2243 domain-containing protein [Longimicrobium sp.]|nr:DUF2243 domain-containing protein [Longimicrobium sp.]